MAINWSWKEKMGTVKVPAANGSMLTLNIYHANCYCIIINEWKDKDGIEQYQVSSFILDDDHLKNMLEENAYSEWTDWKLNARYADSWKIAKKLCKAGITVTMYWEEIENERL